MEIRIYIAERLKSETSRLQRLNEEDMPNPQEDTTLEKLYADGWALKTISPVPEENQFRVYVVVEK